MTDDPAIDGDDAMVLLHDGPYVLHEQISEVIRDRITSGRWPAHYRLKAEPELAQDLGVSRGTLRRALATLIAEGLLRQVRGKGTFVTSSLVEPSIAQRLSSLSEDFANQGVVASTVVLRNIIARPPAPIAGLLDVSLDTDVLELWRVRSTSAGPVALIHNYVRLDDVPAIQRIDFATHSLFAVLERDFGLPLASGRRTFSARLAAIDVARALEIQPGDPVQYIEQITYVATGQPIEYSDVWIDSAKLRVTSVLARH